MKFARLGVLALPVLVGSGLIVVSLRSPYAGFGGEVFVDIPKGTSTREVSRLLAGNGVVRRPWAFLLIRGLRPRARLQAGEYRFEHPASAWEVFDRIARGDVFYYELVVPEGQNVFDIARSLNRLRVIPGEEFLRTARDPALIRDLAPRAPSLEGYLFPDTYRITRHTTAVELCRSMTERFRRAWKQLGASPDVHARVTLASLVEKEAARAEERPIIASVFLNRLRREMSLDCDPTAIYAALLENRYRGELHRSDLESKNRYNTYQHAGLPPGPIANPGLDSLQAALRPAQTDYIYFVVRQDGSGGHQFSRQLEAHRLAVRKYLRGNHKAVQTRSSDRVPRRKPASLRNRSRVAGTSEAAGADF